jgi:hypothetical protein
MQEAENGFKFENAEIPSSHIGSGMIAGWFGSFGITKGGPT